jgi:hypothetical protein
VASISASFAGPEPPGALDGVVRSSAASASQSPRWGALFQCAISATRSYAATTSAPASQLRIGQCTASDECETPVPPTGSSRTSAGRSSTVANGPA